MKRSKLREFVNTILLKFGYAEVLVAPRKGWLWTAAQPNHVLRCNGFAISYIPFNRDKMLPEKDRVGTTEECETAIMFPSGEKDEEGENKNTYLVLNGDHRKAYEDRREDISECMDYYVKNKAEYGSWFSTDNEMEREAAKK